MAKTYEAMQRDGKSPENSYDKTPVLSGWEHLNLKNTRQAGDLEKKLIHFKRKNNASVFNFVSSRNAEGVSTIIVNLAEYMSSKKTGKRILLIDGNLIAPVIHLNFELTPGPGLCDALSDISTAKEYIVESSYDGLEILTCGNLQQSAIKGIDQEKFLNLINSIKYDYDYILIDSTPLLISSDSLSSAIASDITFFVVQSFKTQKEVAEKGKLLLEENDCRIGGVILNRDLQLIPEWLYKII